jgi:hypothetical protein
VVPRFGTVGGEMRVRDSIVLQQNMGRQRLVADHGTGHRDSRQREVPLERCPGECPHTPQAESHNHGIEERHPFVEVLSRLRADLHLEVL